MSAPNKITSGHLSRKAMVYVRQSTMAQVREHTESTARQYGLVEEAAGLAGRKDRSNRRRPGVVGPLGGAARDAQIGVDHLDLRRRPAQLSGFLHQRVLARL